MNKRGQAAMEFLMTYGWAILAAIIVIGVLAIYFRPGSLVTNSVIVNAPFYGVAASVSITDTQFEFKNNGGETLQQVNVTVDFLQPTSCLTNTFVVGDMIAGQSNITTFPCAATAGTTISADVSIDYNRIGSNLRLTSTGSLSGAV